MKLIEKLKGWIAYAPVVCFLALEIIAFTMFSLGDSFLSYSILGLIILLLLVIVTFTQYKKDNLTTYAFFIFPLLIYGILSVISNYSQSSCSVTTRVFVPFALVSFATVGYLLSMCKTFKVKHLVFTIYGVLALVTFINLLLTLINYCPFYTLMYPYYFTYYNGEVSRVAVNEIAYGLIGFSSQQVTIQYFSLFPSLLLTSVIGLFFISPKKEKKEFIALSLFTLLAFITLLFTASKMMIVADVITLLVISLVILLVKFRKLRNKVTAVIGFVLLGLFVLFLIFFTLNANNVGWAKQITTSNSAFNYLFNTNKVSQNYNAILDGIFSSNKLFGFAPYIYNYKTGYIVYPSGNWLIDQFMYGGIFLLIFFIIFLVISTRGAYVYLKTNRDNKVEKTLLLAIILEYFSYSFINGSVLRMVHFYNQNPLYSQGPFLIIILILGYTYSTATRRITNE